MMDLLRRHVAAGKPVIGIRTAVHSFELRGQALPPGQGWLNLDEEVFGADYQDHYGAGGTTEIAAVPAALGNPILNGVHPAFTSPHHLYRSRNLVGTATPLLTGRTSDGRSETEPVAWINTAGGRRVFYTSLGGPDDFANPDFRRLLLNGILWSLDEFIAPEVAKR
jgi:hypothetical protein